MEIQTSEKTYLNIQLEVRNKGGHSSLPNRTTPWCAWPRRSPPSGPWSYRCASTRRRRCTSDSSARCSPSPSPYRCAPSPKNPGNAAAAAQLSAASPHCYNALLRTTCVPTLVSGGHAENALPQSVRVNVNCRLLPDDSPAAVKASIERAIADPQVQVTTQSTARPSPFAAASRHPRAPSTA